MEVIIYKTDNGEVPVIVPTPEALSQRTILEIAVKDVPAGKPFAIIDSSELPFNHPQETWTVQDSDLNDGVGGESNDFS